MWRIEHHERWPDLSSSSSADPSDAPLVIASERHRLDKLVVFVHGLGGDRVDTWGNLPRFLFEDLSRFGVDVGLFGYRSGTRRLFRLDTASFGDNAKLLADAVRVGDYKNILLVGHSMGGLMCKRAVLHLDKIAASDALTRIRGVVLLATPNNGSRRSLSIFQRLNREAALLRVHSEITTDIQEFWNAQVLGATPQIPIPTFAAHAVHDKLVDKASSLLGVPPANTTTVAGTHTSICKPEDRAAPIYGWVRDQTIATLIGLDLRDLDPRDIVAAELLDSADATTGPASSMSTVTGPDGDDPPGAGVAGSPLPTSPRLSSPANAESPHTGPSPPVAHRPVAYGAPGSASSVRTLARRRWLRTAVPLALLAVALVIGLWQVREPDESSASDPGPAIEEQPVAPQPVTPEPPDQAPSMPNAMPTPALAPTPAAPVPTAVPDSGDLAFDQVTDPTPAAPVPTAGPTSTPAPTATAVPTPTSGNSGSPPEVWLGSAAIFLSSEPPTQISDRGRLAIDTALAQAATSAPDARPEPGAITVYLPDDDLFDARVESICDDFAADCGLIDFRRIDELAATGTETPLLVVVGVTLLAGGVMVTGTARRLGRGSSLHR